jgi:hypothetical protein
VSRSALPAIAALAVVLATPAHPAAAQEPAPTPPVRVQVRIPTDTTIPWSDGRLPIEVRGIRGALITVTIIASDAGARPLLSQTLPAGVSATVWWNAREIERPLTPSGRYLLRVAAVDEAGGATTALERVLLVSRAPADTTAEPPPLDTSALLPERAIVRMGDPLPMLSGIITGVAAVFLPELLSRSNLRSAAGGNGWRLGVAGVAIAAGIFGFVTSEGPQPLAENITTNRALRDQDARDRVLLRDANARAREAARVRIRAEERAP